MYQSNTHSIKKVLVVSATLAAASLLFNVAPASACTMSQGAKAKATSPLSASVAAMALSQMSQPAKQGNKNSGFVGLWDLKISSGGQVFDEGFDAFHRDGTEILVTEDNPITENVCLGAWEQTGESTIKVKHPSWYFDTNGNLLGVVIIYETLKLDPDGDSFHGTSVEDIYDTQGNKIGHLEAQLEANRITVS